jgi:hypothetical protein
MEWNRFCYISCIIWHIHVNVNINLKSFITFSSSWVISCRTCNGIRPSILFSSCRTSLFKSSENNRGKGVSSLSQKSKIRYFPISGVTYAFLTFSIKCQPFNDRTVCYFGTDAFHSLRHFSGGPQLTPAGRMAISQILERFQASHHDLNSHLNSPDISLNGFSHFSHKKMSRNHLTNVMLTYTIWIMSNNSNQSFMLYASQFPAAVFCNCQES